MSSPTGLPTRRDGVIAVPARRARFRPDPGLIVAEKYRVDQVIGEGGMGIVVAATHVGLDQRVAIKFLLPEATRNAEVVERFTREARIAAKIKSEHVASVSDVGIVEDGTPFIVMEHLEGADLGALLKRDGPLPVEEACEITLQACEALAEVHAAGIVHRDLKPSNLFVTRRADGSPCVKLLDFGISKLTDPGAEGEDPALTATATIMGSPSYMSPEQLRSTKEVDARTDVWSLGAVLYEAVTGRGAFKRETVPQVCAMIASEEPAPPSSIIATLPEPLEGAILGCLVKNPDQRSSLVELARRLVPLAPDRARVSLERVEAMMGQASSPRPALPSEVSKPRVREPSPTARSVTAEPASLPRERDRRGGAPWKTLFVLAAVGLLGAGVATGRIDIHQLTGQIAGSSSSAPAVPPLASVVAPIASAIAPMASAVAPIASAAIAPLASAVAPLANAVAPIASAIDDVENAAGEATDEDTEDPAPSSSVATSSSAPVATPPRPALHTAPAKHNPHPRPWPSKGRHHRH